MSSVAEKLARKSAAPTSKQVRLNLAHVSMWSVVKVCIVIGLGFAILSGLVLVVLWLVLTALGIPQQVESLIGLSATTGATSGSALGTKTMLAVAVIVGTLNFIGVVVAGVVVAIIYKLYARLTGGLLMGFSNT
jgi:hypothetical protein